MPAHFPRAQAYLRGAGVRVDAPGMNDYWCAVMVAEILWPGMVKRTKNADLRDLLYQLRKLGKKQRASAQKYRHLIPVDFRAGVE